MNRPPRASLGASGGTQGRTPGVHRERGPASPPGGQPALHPVRLVGAGPGDPELLTLKALRAVQEASVVLVDDLVSSEVQALIPAAVRRVAVGKRGGCRSTPQAFITRLMVRLALRGERVVRLKGGDPMLFGRAGEEAEALRAAGLEVEVINGITAGLAGPSTLGIPLTHRHHAQGVVFITGHARTGGEPPNWEAVGRAAAALHLTVVIYMGMGELQRLSQGLAQGWGRADVPVLVVERASTPQQRQVAGTLATVEQAVTQQGLGSPSVLVVGDVVRGCLALQSPEAAWNVVGQSTGT